MDGQPRSWRLFRVGVAHLEREGARASLRLARAFRIAQTTERARWEEWEDTQTRAAGE